MSWKGKLGKVDFFDLYPEVIFGIGGDEVEMPMRTSDLFEHDLARSNPELYDRRVNGIRHIRVKVEPGVELRWTISPKAN